MTPSPLAPTLRQVLQRETRDLHDNLDATLGAAPLDADCDYAAFLSVQYSARAGVEKWALANLVGNLHPPPVARLIADDLRALGAAIPSPASFTLPEHTDPLGVAWALGGSALGNKALLLQRRRAGADHAERFLSDSSTALYFRTLLPRLEVTVAPGAASAAVAGARAVFEAFLGAVRSTALQVAA